ncbi:hypothetical protein D9M73_226000 [compost metagenome]
MRDTHRQCHHLASGSRSFEADIDQKTWRPRLAEVEVQMDSRAVIANEAGNLPQCLAGRNAGSRNGGDRPQHMQVLVLGHAQAEIRAIELSRRKFQKFDQRPQWHPRIFLHQQVRMDAKALEHRVGLATELVDDFTEPRE